jgi:hypothetical protein
MHCRDKLKTNKWKRQMVLSYFVEDKWNTLDFVTILIYLIGFITRFIVIEEAFIVSK